MSVTLRAALLAFSIYVITKLVLFNIGKHDEWYMLVVFQNILCIIIAMVFTLRGTFKEKGPSKGYVEDVKIAMRGAALYVILASAFAYFFYSAIDHDYMHRNVEAQMVRVRAVNFDSLQKANPDRLAALSRDSFVEKEQEYAEMIYSAFFSTTVMLVGSLLLSFFYSLVIAWVWKKFAIFRR
jgi:hypothetical protein